MTNYENIKKFTIFGERNSGTTYLTNILQKTLHLNFTTEYGYKHWYIKGVTPRGINNTTTDNECNKPINDNNDTLFIVIVRNPYDWAGAMYKRPYHIKINGKNKTSIYKFISNKYICFEKKCPPRHDKNSESPWHKNKNNKYPYFIEESKNLIELRNLKNNHFNNLKKYVKHYFLLRNEHLIDDINKMIKTFNLQHSKLDLSNYKTPNKYILNKQTFTFINKNLNNQIDNKIYKL